MSANDFPPEAFDPSKLPNFEDQFINGADLEAFAKALSAPESTNFVSLNDWAPIHRSVRKRVGSRRARKVKKTQRSVDETREGFVYTIFQWPLLLIILGWIVFLGSLYWLTRVYVSAYERLVTWRGRRQNLRQNIQSQRSYENWRKAAMELDAYLGNDQWKERDEYAYYDHVTITKATQQLQSELRQLRRPHLEPAIREKATAQLRQAVETCVKYNFAGIENPRLYSETYYGTKNLVQQFIDQLHAALTYLLSEPSMSTAAKQNLFAALHTNFGRSALALSGGASFAFYHFGIVKALLDSSLLPDVVTGTSGGAMVAALVATRTNDELKALLIPALAHKIDACSEPFPAWFLRWWRTGARFDALEWARKCAWFTRGSITFREAFQRTGRILNVSCVPSDPHSPTALINYMTAPDCVIWSAVLASAAVPGILPAIPMMQKLHDGSLIPASYGHKWKDGSLKTDIPLKALNLHFKVLFPIVSQVNPHINAFFYASKGSIGRPVTHRKGRGWRGGYLGSATEAYLKLELQKFLKMLRHLELLPRPLGQDWSSIWLQKFSGTITIWPKAIPSDYWYILSDPSPPRLARMLLTGQRSTWPKLLFIENRMKIERLLEQGLMLGAGSREAREASFNSANLGNVVGDRLSKTTQFDTGNQEPTVSHLRSGTRRSSVLEEIKRQSTVFFDDTGGEGDETGESEIEDLAPVNHKGRAD